MKKKIIYLVIVTIIASLLNINTVKASDTVTQNVVDFSNGVMNGYSKLLRYAGMIIDTGIEVNRQSISFIKQQLIKLGLLSSGASDKDVEDFFDDNITKSGQNVSFSQNMNIYIKNEQKEIIEEYGFMYCYSYDIVKNTSKFASGDLYNACKHFIEQYQDSYFVMLKYINNTSSCEAFIVDQNVAGLVRDSELNTDRIVSKPINYNTWNYPVCKRYKFNESSKVFVYYSDLDPSFPGDYLFGMSKIMNNSPGNAADKNLYSYNGEHVYKVYKSLSDFKTNSVGQSPYYISDSYNTYQDTTGSYNTTTTDNSVTYGDITNYINSFNTQNGKNPTPQEIKVYITVTNGNGGGSGNGSGSGSGGDSGDLGIFDFLSRIGAVLGNLIKNLGNVLAELVEGLAETVNSLFESIPTVFNTFMQGVFSWLPTELLSIITLGIAAMILVGIIKIFKG